MTQILMFVFTCAAGLAQYGMLLLNINLKPKIWLRGLYVGMIGSAYSAGAFLVPSIELYPCLAFIFCIAIMVVHLLVAYYRTPIPDSYTDSQREERIEVKQSTVKQLGIGLIVTIIMAGVAGYTQTQSNDSRVQQGFAGVVYKLADEVKSLHAAVVSLAKDVKVLQDENKARIQSDSLARKRTLQNQEQILKHMKRR